MQFFRTSPNLPDGEKARIELHYQQLAEHLGPAKFLLPVVSLQSILSKREQAHDAQQIKELVGRHLGFDVRAIQIQHQPQLPVKQSGGGG